jgi:hypothetical protein
MVFCNSGQVRRALKSPDFIDILRHGVDLSPPISYRYNFSYSRSLPLSVVAQWVVSILSPVCYFF